MKKSHSLIIDKHFWTFRLILSTKHFEVIFWVLTSSVS